MHIRHTDDRRLEGYIEGRVLIAMPTLEDPNFARTVIYVCSHSEEGAMGLIINQPMVEPSFRELLQQLELIPETNAIELPQQVERLSVCFGGPVDTGRGFVLHSPDYRSESSTQELANGICLTATLDILKAIASGRGPNKAMLALGYAGWSAGQIEQELQDNAWLVTEADNTLLFDIPPDEKYTYALHSLGIAPEHFPSQAGHA